MQLRLRRGWLPIEEDVLRGGTLPHSDGGQCRGCPVRFSQLETIGGSCRFAGGCLMSDAKCEVGIGNGGSSHGWFRVMMPGYTRMARNGKPLDSKSF